MDALISILGQVLGGPCAAGAHLAAVHKTSVNPHNAPLYLHQSLAINFHCVGLDNPRMLEMKATSEGLGAQSHGRRLISIRGDMILSYPSCGILDITPNMSVSLQLKMWCPL